MKDLKWMVVQSGHADYVAIRTETADTNIAYFPCNKDSINDIVKECFKIVENHNQSIKNEAKC